MSHEQMMTTAVAHHQAGRLSDAEALYRQILRENGKHADALNLLGVIAGQVGRRDEAIDLINRAIKISPEIPGYYYNLGLMRAGQRKWEEAISAYRKVLKLRPGHPEVMNHLGVALYRSGDLDAALEMHRRAVRLQPGMANAHVDLANVLQAKGQLDAAMAECRQAIALSPNLAAAHMALGILHLQRGELPAGWAEYEWRWHLTGEKMYRIDFPQPYWFGAALEGKRILLHAEQGLGDTLQFVRYAPLVAERGGRVILAVQPELMELMRSVKGVEQVVARLGPLPEFDTHCPLLSLPRLFQTTLETIPTGAPYLSADEKRRADWQARLPGDQRKKIGLVWAGKDWPNPNRSISPEELSALTSAPDAWWCSLQKQDAGGPPGLELTDWTGELQDFSDTAALIANLDLVITIDSATAHLAGALGKPVWVLLPFMADWRWMQDRSDSPWYPTARLFRQSRAGDWTGAIGHVIEALKGSC